MFEWDEDKRVANLAKHKLDFVDARSVFDGRAATTSAARHAGEVRFVTTALMTDKFYTIVWT